MRLVPLLLLAVAWPPAPAAARAAASASSRTVTTIAAVGDIACEPGRAVTDATCRQGQVADLVGRIDPRAVFLLGDIQYLSGAADAFQASFDPAWGRFRSIWRPVPGNHEYLTAGAAGYYGYFGSAAGSSARGYYSFDLAGWHFVALNSNCDFVPCGSDSEQLRWLRADLRRNHRRCVAALWHHPLFSSGSHGGDVAVQPLWQELRAARAEFVLSGHDHHFEQFRRQDGSGTARAKTGLVQFVVGTGGKSVYAAGPPSKNSRTLVSGVFGALAIDLRRSGYRWRFIDESGAERATGRAGCR